MVSLTCSEDTAVFILCLAFHDMRHLGSETVAPKLREELLISRKLLLLLVLMSAELTLEGMHTLNVIQSVHLQAKGK